MKLTRKHLNHILTSLPHPRLVEEGKVAPFFKVPVYKSDHLIKESLLPNYHEAEIKEIRFRYDYREMDWILEDFEI